MRAAAPLGAVMWAPGGCMHRVTIRGTTPGAVARVAAGADAPGDGAGERVEIDLAE